MLETPQQKLLPQHLLPMGALGAMEQLSQRPTARGFWCSGWYSDEQWSQNYPLSPCNKHAGTWSKQDFMVHGLEYKPHMVNILTCLKSLKLITTACPWFFLKTIFPSGGKRPIFSGKMEVSENCGCSPQIINSNRFSISFTIHFKGNLMFGTTQM